MVSDDKRKTQKSYFLPLAFSTVALTLGLIVFGAVVRVTDSGLGCGNHWPLCNGTIFPPLDNVTAWIEWLHRLFAALIGLFGLGMLYTAWQAYREQNRAVMKFVVLAAVLFVVQSGLGAIVVLMELPPTFVTLHLGTSMLLLGALIASGIVAWYKPNFSFERNDSITLLTYANAVFTLIIIMTGALVRGAGATLACTDWPLCNGVIFPADQGQLALIHMFHRFAVLALGISLVMLIYQTMKHRTGFSRNLAMGAFVAYLAQAGIGALYVLSVAGAFWGAAHVGMAATTWALLIILSVVEGIDAGHIRVQTGETWKQQSEVRAVS
jgi:heme A synthase